MLIYWVVFFILFLFSYVELISARQSLVLLRCVTLFIACMVGFRYNIGADWETYVIIYNRQIPSLLDPEYRILMEPLFWILGSLCKTLGLSYACFFIILSLISFVVLFIVIRRIGCGYIYLPILLYFCLFFCQFQLNIVRHGIMASFVWLAFSYIKECSLKKFVFFLLIAAGFQLAALAFFPFYFLLNRCYMQKSVVTLIFISLIFVMLGVSQKILLLGTKIPVFGEFVNYYILDFYGRNVDASYGFSVGMIVNLFLFLFLYFGMRSVYNDISNHLKIFVNLLLYSFILSCFFNAYAVFVERLVSVTNMTLLFILPYVLHKIFIGKVNKTIAFACIVVYAMLMFTKTLYTPVPLGGKYEYQFIPYQYSFVI